ncbi:hypothetical protein RMATCC62417_13889 [Rhizopus microsporus]|nr:hypothetical protein RMATCC62417_13889 [Rhizopus microsporus]
MDSLVKAEIKQHDERKSKQQEQELDSVTDMLKSLSFGPVTNTGYMLELLELKKGILSTISQPDLLSSDFDDRYEQTVIPKEKEEVKPLTDQENKLVDSVFKLGQHGTLSEYKNATVEYKDIYKLRPETWLNDEIINFYFALLADRASHDPSMPAIHCFSTFFCSTLREQGYAKVRRWTKRVDIFTKDFLFVPINKSYHWVLGVIDMKNKKISIYDSLHGKDDYTLKLLLTYLEEEHLDKKKTPYDTSDWTLESPQNIPKQGNAYDCGVFTCAFAERISRQKPLDFTQNDMNLIRRRMVINILNKHL